MPFQTINYFIIPYIDSIVLANESNEITETLVIVSYLHLDLNHLIK